MIKMDNFQYFSIKSYAVDVTDAILIRLWLYKRLPEFIRYEKTILTAAVSHVKKFIYTAAVHQVSKCYLYGSRFSYGQRHVILSPIDAHYKWPQNKFIHTFRNS